MGDRLAAVSLFFSHAIGAYGIAACVAFGILTGPDAADRGPHEPREHGRTDHVHYDVLPVHDIDFLLQI